MVRKGMITILNQFNGIEVVLEAENGKDLIDQCTDNAPDIVLMDVNMPVMDGYEAAKWLRNNAPNTRVIGLSQEDDSAYILKMIEVGGKGYLLKNCSPQELEEAIKSVHKQGIFLNAQINLHVMNSMNKKMRLKDAAAQEFSDQEKNILLLLAEGKSANEIAQVLVKSTRTIENAKARMMSKAGASNTVHLVVYALKNNIIEIEEITSSNEDH